MNSLLRNIVNQLKEKPKTLFLIDSTGAFITAFLLFAVLRNFKEYIGMPQPLLTYLSLIALIFCLYSAACFIFVKKHFRPFLIGIGIANLLYCTLTIGLLISNRPLLTTLGISYFLTEIVIIYLLAYCELKVADVAPKHPDYLSNNKSPVL